MARITVEALADGNAVNVQVVPPARQVISIDRGLFGPQGPQGPQGDPGQPGVGVPAGGTDGQILTKVGTTDYETEWANPPEAGVSSVNGQTGAVTLTASDVGAPSTTGAGATGTWAIGVSGNAATATTANYATSAGSATTAGNVTGTVAIANGGTGSTTAANARAALDVPSTTGSGASGTWAIDITGNSANVSGVVALSHGGTAATTAPDARTNLGLGSAAVLNAGVALGAATLDAGGTIPLSQLPASIQGGVSYQSAWNASTNSPALVSGVGTKGYYYVVSVNGSTNLDGITDWKVGDWAIFNGTIWQKIDNTESVTSVNGYTGAVALTASDVGAATAAQGTKADTALQPADVGTAAYQNTTAFATAAQGTKADTALQPADVGSAAYQSTTAFATAAQGAKADTAVQPSSLATVATTGAYADLSGKPTLATVATTGAYSDLTGTPTIPSALTVKDEGTTLTSAATSVNFVGAGVTATNSGTAVTVTIVGGGTGGGGLEQVFLLMGA